MFVPAGTLALNGDKISIMGTYETDSVGARIAWARKQKKITGAQLARTVNVRNVYISQIENNHKRAALPLLQRIATTLGVSVGFLLMETDDPAPARSEEDAPVYFSPEADTAARLIDAVPPEERARILVVVRAMVEMISRVAKEKTNEAGHLIASPRLTFAQRLIDGERESAHRRELSR